MARILLIDDDPIILEVIAETLGANGYEVVTAPTGESGIKELETNHYDLVLTDLVMPNGDGMDVLNHVATKLPQTMCIIFTGYGTIKNSVDAVKKGAFDYITKPVKSDELLVVMEKALRHKSLEEENIRLKKELRQKYRYNNIVGTSKALKTVYDLIEKVADTDSTLLISGASGTGKELIARAVHYNSSRSDKPLVVINCGAIPEQLLESELFGHEKGSFTGAYKSKVGRFEMANGGTIFLDEIGDMSPALQVKLLRVLQEQKFERVGGTKTIHVDVRIIAATNKNLTIAINKGLKQRRSDIPLLIDYFIKRFQRGKTKRITGFSPQAMDAMVGYGWPGNVREVQNVIKRLTILCDNEVVGFDDLPDHIQQNSRSVQPGEEDILEEGLTLGEAVKDYEKRLILEALEKSSWIKTKAAKVLNIKRTTLVEKIKKQNFTEAAAA